LKEKWPLNKEIFDISQHEKELLQTKEIPKSLRTFLDQRIQIQEGTILFSESSKDDECYLSFIADSGTGMGNFAFHLKMKSDRIIVSDLRRNRSYATTPLGTLKGSSLISADSSEFQILSLIYNQVCESWRNLVDIRFKLLTLLPLASGAAFIGILSDFLNIGLSIFSKTVVTLLGIFVTFAFWIYDRRNSELHNDLISRGRKIEDELGVESGLFRGRMNPSNWLVKHGRTLAMIHGFSFLGWIAVLVLIWIQQ